ncbi:MAG: hypothetical protein JNJ88_16300 [Planctomycetes bacterium]|nr:hypothetical protein [Planctomycetota bacterium]
MSNVLNVNSLLEIGSDHMGPEPPLRTGVPKRPDYQTIESRDPSTLTAWLLVLGPDALSFLLPRLRQATSEHELASFAFGIRDCIERWLTCVTGRQDHFFSAGVWLAEATKPFMEELERRLLVAGLENHNLRRAWLWFVRCTAEAGDPQDETHVAPDTRERALHAANESIARLRPLLARARVRDALHTEVNSKSSVSGSASSLEPWEEFEWEKDHLMTCATILYLFGGLWRGMKPMLLAMRALACPCVASDLRYWEEDRQRGRDAPSPEPTQPPTPWQLIPTLMVNLFHGFARREQQQDPELQSLRGEFAAFCLRGLADRWTERERREAAASGRPRTNDDMLERSPDWRYCLVRAAMALHINPEGKGHRILEAASRIDPDPDVRSIAREAYETLRRSEGLPDGVSPRRTVMSAFWWFRQAHLLSLGFEIDADGAQRTRVKELTRTRDQEAYDKPQS